MGSETFEVNFDGLVGPFHTYGGLSYGNIAAMGSRCSISNPRAALFQGLDKMRLLMSLGLKQALLPPQERPAFDMLRRVGYSGADARIIEKVARDDPVLLSACYSSSSMWAANVATVSPSADTADGRVHFTPANLVTNFHRAIETRFTGRSLRELFKDPRLFRHHDPLPSSITFSDEGAANHTRLCSSYDTMGVELFVYGRKAWDLRESEPRIFPGRQSYEASVAVARLHQLDPTRCMFARQNAHCIDAGVFHNDVISVGNRNVFLYHSEAFADTARVIAELRRVFTDVTGEELRLIEIRPDQVPVPEAVRTYLFNSQLVTLPDGSVCLVAPAECEESEPLRNLIDELVRGDSPIGLVRYVDVRQSMKNGGGPACLRLRVVLTEEELAATHAGVIFDERLYHSLRAWGERFYRDRLGPDDLADPSLVEEGRAALSALTDLLGLGSLYDFQRV